jgi:hypothetical protein
MAGVNGQSTSTPINLVLGKKSLAAARTEVLRLGESDRPTAADQLPLTLPLAPAQLAALGADRFVLGGAMDRPLLDQLGMHCIANLDGPGLDRVQPTESIAIVDLAQFFTQLTSEDRNPLLYLLTTCHP